MKKSVVILIAIIYVLAIALVSFFGLQFKMFEQIIPVETLEILNEGLLQSEKWGRYTVVNLVGGNGEFRIEYRVHPDDATNKTLDFKPTVVTGSDTVLDHVSVGENGVVTINGLTEFAVVKITVTSLDNVEATQTITLMLIPG